MCGCTFGQVVCQLPFGALLQRWPVPLTRNHAKEEIFIEAADLLGKIRCIEGPGQSHTGKATSTGGTVQMINCTRVRSTALDAS
jgi:hypothetical protein